MVKLTSEANTDPVDACIDESENDDGLLSVSKVVRELDSVGDGSGGV